MLELTLLRGLAPLVTTAALFLGCASPARRAERAPSHVRGAAGSALLPFVRATAESLTLHHPDVALVSEEARSSAALKKLIAGELELAFTSRPVRPEEDAAAERAALSLHMVVVAAEAVVVVVHPSNPLRDLDRDTLRRVFFEGSVRDWGELTDGAKRGPIRVLAVDPKTSGTGELFVSTIAGEERPSYVDGATVLEFSDGTAARVADDPDAISFSGVGNVDERVRALSIDGIAASDEAILDTSYILNRKLFAVTGGSPKGPAREVVKFMLSQRGQELARAVGVTPVVLQ
jgi:phosphate transport system substrate-binding protein